MGKQYEPGTVARVDIDYGDQGFNDELAIRVSNASFTGWTAANGATANDAQARNIRPLVVLDRPAPDLQYAVRVLATGGFSAMAAYISAQIRPDEPTGLGAVVKDRDGALWVRNGYRTQPWQTDDARGVQEFADIDVVEVLAEGYQHGWYDRGGVLRRGTTS